MPCVIDGVPAAIQSLNTGIREASFSDATVRLRSFEALAVSQSLHGKNGISWLCLHCIDMSDRAATTSYLARTSYAAPRLFHHLFRHHLTLRSVSFFAHRPLEACGAQLPPRCFTLRVQHLVPGSASFSDATVRLRSFEALAVSQSLHGKNGISVMFFARS